MYVYGAVMCITFITRQPINIMVGCNNIVQWNPFTADTIGTQVTVLISG